VPRPIFAIICFLCFIYVKIRNFYCFKPDRYPFITKRYCTFSRFKGDNLGNIRQTFIKNVAIQLVKTYPEQFVANDFQHNKEKVAELCDVSTKLMRNRIAGYVTRYLSSQRKGKAS
jgi:small subunit ribosomal protein S17e